MTALSSALGKPALLPFQERPLFSRGAWAVSRDGQFCQIVDWQRNDYDGMRVVVVRYRDNLEAAWNGHGAVVREEDLLPIDRASPHWREEATSRHLAWTLPGKPKVAMTRL